MLEYRVWRVDQRAYDKTGAVDAFFRGERSSLDVQCRKRTRLEYGFNGYVRWRCGAKGRDGVFLEAYLADGGVQIRARSVGAPWRPPPALPVDLALPWERLRPIINKAKRAHRKHLADAVAFASVEMRAAAFDSSHAIMAWRFYVEKYGAALEGDKFEPGRMDFVPAKRSVCLAAYCAARAAQAATLFRVWAHASGPPAPYSSAGEVKRLVEKTFIDEHGFFCSMHVWAPAHAAFMPKHEDDDNDEDARLEAVSGWYPLTLDACAWAERRRLEFVLRTPPPRTDSPLGYRRS